MPLKLPPLKPRIKWRTNIIRFALGEDPEFQPETELDKWADIWLMPYPDGRAAIQAAMAMPLDDITAIEHMLIGRLGFCGTIRQILFE
jgi:hypothetical protein